MALQVRPRSGMTFAWEEYISTKGTTHDFAYGFDGSQVVMQIDVPWNSVGLATTEILGVSTFVPNSNPVKLQRRIPWRCPYDSGMWATRIASIKGLKPQAKAFEDLITYERARFIVQFSRLPYRVIDDGALQLRFQGKEYYRYTTRRIQPSAEFITRKEGSFKFAQGISSSELVGSVSQRLSKETVEWIWHNVPAHVLFGANGDQLPNNQIANSGNVNNSTFQGFAAGTLLLLPTEFREKTKPDGFNTGPLGDPYLIYDVVFRAVHFDPPFFGGAFRGHNLLPIPGDASGKWGLVTHDGTLPGRPIHDSFDFETLWVGNYS